MNGRGIMDTILAVDNIDKHEKMIDALYKEYLKRVDTQLKAAIPNIEKAHFENGIYFNMIDVEKYAHKFTFLLLEKPAVLFMIVLFRNWVRINQL